MLTSDDFLKYLRDALNHLYDPGHLRKSPLAELLGVSQRLSASLSLQDILTQALETLKPQPSDPPRSPTRRAYELLTYRYLRQFSQQEVADQLGVSVRQLAREQNLALEVLAGYLCKQYNLETQLCESPSAAGAPDPSETTKEDLTWLQDVPVENLPDLHQLVPQVIELVQPLADAQGGRVDVADTEGLPSPAAHPVALRQMLINLLTDAIQTSPGATIRLAAQVRPGYIEIGVQSAGAPAAASVATNMETTRRLAALSGGALVLGPETEPFAATLTLPAFDPITVLVVDDNTDALELLKRYASGTRYRLIATRDPERVIALAEQHAPRVILLDIMMPQVDGWQVLASLRQHPAASQTRILVCTILAQEALALSLGANGLLRKPITRQTFLAALDAQVAPRD